MTRRQRRELCRELTGEYRRLAHKHFDQLWRHGGPVQPWMSRDVAYRWLADWLGVSTEQAHIGRMSAAQCRELIRAVEDLVAREGRHTRRRHRPNCRGRKRFNQRRQHRWVERQEGMR